MEQQWQTDQQAWAAGWDAVQGDHAAPRLVRAWDGSVPSEEGAALVCAADESVVAAEAVRAAGREILSTHVLLAGSARELDRGLDFPGDAGMFDAPMDDHVRFEVDEWGRPVAHSTLSVQGEVAFVGPLLMDGNPNGDPAEVLDPLMSAMANEAFLADAERLYTAVPEEDVVSRESQGWRRAAVVLRMS